MTTTGFEPAGVEPTAVEPIAIVDLRDSHEYARERPAGAVAFALGDLVQHAYLLSPPSRPLVLVGGDAVALRSVIAALAATGRSVRHVPEASWKDEFPVETGQPSRAYVWEPSQLVQRAIATYLPTLPGKTAMDIACGSGRNAVYMALHGLDVTGIDRLPEALQRARDLARRHGVGIQTREIDVEKSGALRDMTADLVVVVRWLDRNLFADLQASLAPGGLLAYETFTQAQAEFGHPRSPRHLLQPGELQNAFPGLETLEYAEGFFAGAHLARLLARRPCA